MKKLFYSICIFLMMNNLGYSQVGIGTANPNASAALEIVSTSSGLLVPRMTQTQRNAITTPATGLLIYQTDAIPGFYYYNGLWTPFVSPNWSLIGNSATNPTTNFIGTTDSQSFIFKTNNTERINVLSIGNIGFGTSTPSTKLHLFGTLRIEDGWQGAGKVLMSNALGNSSWTNSSAAGIGGWNTSGNAGTTGTTNYMGTNDIQNFIIKTNNTENVRILDNGNVGINTSAPTSKLEVTSNLSNQATIKGINTNTTSGTISYGVQGEGKSTGLGASGLSGITTNGGQNEIGVLGDYAQWGAGVAGLGYNLSGSTVDIGLSYMNTITPARDYGVYGSVNYPGGFGIYGYDAGNYTGSIANVDLISYALYGNGKFATTGTKSASIPTTQGNQLVYCAESPEIWFEDLGNAKLENGSKHILLDDLFLETVFIDATHKIKVFLQEEGECNGLIVIKDQDSKGFVVKEKNGGTSNINFSYRIMAKRRFYQNQRFGVDSAQPLEDNLAKAKDARLATTDVKKVRTALTNSISEKEKRETKKASN